MGYRKHDKIKAFKPKTKYLTHDKDYWIEWVSAGGYIGVRNDVGEIKPYAPSNFRKLPMNIPDVIESPTQLEPVLAEIEHINDLGKSKWYEVVYFDENWQSYSGSRTFQDGEKVVRWKYAKDCL